MFWAEIRKIMYTPVNPSFTIYKWCLRGSKLYRHVFVMSLCWINIVFSGDPVSMPGGNTVAWLRLADFAVIVYFKSWIILLWKALIRDKIISFNATNDFSLTDCPSNHSVLGCMKSQLSSLYETWQKLYNILVHDATKCSKFAKSSSVYIGWNCEINMTNLWNCLRVIKLLACRTA